MLVLAGDAGVGLAAKGKLPHVLFVLVDDVGYADVGFTGGTAIPTPTLDRLASEGLVLQNYYTHPVCTPTRTALMTGRYSAASGIQHPFLVGDEGLPLMLSREHGGGGLLPEMLRDRFGYRTLMAGKWHLGHSTWQHMPTRRGFDRFYGFLSAAVSHDTKYLWTPQLPGYDLWEQENPVMNVTHSSLLYTEKLIAMAASELESGTDSPLFMYLALGAAHSPLQCTEDQLRRCMHLHSSMRRRYCGLVQSIDDAVLRMEQALDALGIKDDTVIIFSSDNGGQPWEGARNYPLRGAKHTPFEGGAHVPAFVRLPEHLKNDDSPSTFEGLMHVADWKPTLEGLLSRLSDEDTSTTVESQLEEVSLLSGVDQSTALLMGEPYPREDVLLHYSNANSLYGAATVGYRFGKWKVVVDQHGGGDLSRWFPEPHSFWDWVPGEPAFLDIVMESCLIGVTYILPEDHLFIVNEMVHRFAMLWAHSHLALVGLEDWGMDRSSEPQGTRVSRGLPVLYDLDEDPSERNDLSEQHPELLEELMSRIIAIETEIRDSVLYVRHEERRLQESPRYPSARGRALQLVHDNTTGLSFHGPWLQPNDLPVGLTLVSPSTTFVPPLVLAQYALVAEGLLAAAVAGAAVLCLCACGCCCCNKAKGASVHRDPTHSEVSEAKKKQ